jgi:hypothetical protein
MLSLHHSYNHNYFFLNLLYQPYFAMANHLIRVEDLAAIAATSQYADDQVDQYETTRLRHLNGDKSPDKTANVPLANGEDDEDIPELVPAPLSVTLSPRTAAMVLEAAGPGDGNILLDNAKDLATTLRLLKARLDESLEDARQANERANRAADHAQDAENRANEVEDRLEESEKNKENEPPRGRRRRRNHSSDSEEEATVCPQGFEENKGQAEGFYIPNDDGESIEPKYVRFVQGGTLHAEGTEGKGFPIYQFALAANPDYEDTDLPLAQMPIWFTAALSRHNNMYNTVLQAALQHNNWGICADIVRYRHTEDQIGIWEARAEEAAQRVERAREERTQARFRLEAARAHRHFTHLQRTNEPEDWRYDDDPNVVVPLRQLGRRGRRNVRGRGQPRD